MNAVADNDDFRIRGLAVMQRTHLPSARLSNGRPVFVFSVTT
jgi:hypothetical protein